MNLVIKNEHLDEVIKSENILFDEENINNKSKINQETPKKVFGLKKINSEKDIMSLIQAPLMTII